MKVLSSRGSGRPMSVAPPATRPTSPVFSPSRGHEVEVVTTADAKPAAERLRCAGVAPRPVGVRHVRGAAACPPRARRAEVVYTTGMFGRSSTGAHAGTAAATSLKLTADPAFERSRRRGPWAATSTSSRPAAAGPWASRSASAQPRAPSRRVRVLPERLPAKLVLSWGVPLERVSVLPNPVPLVTGSATGTSSAAASGSTERRSRSRAG